MSKNKNVKRMLILKYGNICFIEELGLRTKEDIDKERKQRYKGDRQLAICDKITYHHILERCKGGKSTVENGALLRYINHQWFHRLSKEQQSQINELFKEYKQTHSTECTVEYVDKVDTDYEIHAFTFIPEDFRQKKKYNRAKDKRENQKIINEWEEEKC